ncbi:YybH family protein [Paraburkholderia flava]|uniref:YybH family protein n=1 Tax=Paraburkholderia flava TaxID=2547393 RepID=UPI0010621EE6|nr:nuclear transport factor 2 family protein [Paraburkholderia flava]
MKRTILSILAAIALTSAAHAATPSHEAEARALFTKFVAAQNAHDPSAVRSMLWDSPQMLFFSRGVETRGADTVVKRFSDYYQGTWHLEPDMSKFDTATITDNVVQILVPIVFTRALPGGQPQSNTFLISQTFVKDAHGWHVASILPVANTQLK